MALSGIEGEVRRFVFRLLGSGLALGDLVSDIVEVLPAHEYPGEQPAQVALDMLCGSVTTGFGAVDPADLRRAVELIEMAHDRAIEHLKLALALRRRMEGGDGGRTRG